MGTSIPLTAGNKLSRQKQVCDDVVIRLVFYQPLSTLLASLPAQTTLAETTTDSHFPDKPNLLKPT